jgi:hypothetical protein
MVTSSAIVVVSFLSRQGWTCAVATGGRGCRHVRQIAFARSVRWSCACPPVAWGVSFGTRAGAGCRPHREAATEGLASTKPIVLRGDLGAAALRDARRSQTSVPAVRSPAPGPSPTLCGRLGCRRTPAPLAVAWRNGTARVIADTQPALQHTPCAFEAGLHRDCSRSGPADYGFPGCDHLSKRRNVSVDRSGRLEWRTQRR